MRKRSVSFPSPFLLGMAAAAAGLVAVPTLVAAQTGPMGATPLAVDLKKVPVGSWAEYKIGFGDQNAQARWALVGRKSDSVTIEMQMEGGPANQMGGGKMTARMTMAPDPTKSDHAIKQMVMQMEGQDPMEMPTQGMNQKFEKPDPKKLVGKESITVPAGDFATSHYRDKNDRGDIDMWISETAPPLGLVKMSFQPKAGSPMPKVGMELSGKGKDAKPVITKTPKPFDPAAMMAHMKRPGGPGAGASGAGAAPGAPAAPGTASAPGATGASGATKSAPAPAAPAAPAKPASPAAPAKP